MTESRKLMRLLALPAYTVGAVLMVLPLVSLFDPALMPIAAKSAWLVWSFGVALVMLGYSSARGARDWGLVVFSIFIGGTAQLWLTEPLWFPSLNLRPSGTGVILQMGLLAFQGAIAIAVLWRSLRSGAVAGWWQKVGGVKIALLLALSFALSISAQGYLPHGNFRSYGFNLTASSALIVLNFMSVAALLCLPAPAISWKRITPYALFFLVLFASAATAWFSFEHIPHVEDETAYLFQARTLLHGALSAPAPPAEIAKGLEFYLLDVQNGRWFATTPPGWPAILAMGEFFGVPWLVNPLLGAFSILLGHGIARNLAGRQHADILAILMACSPWFVSANASLMAHTTAIFFALLSWRLLTIPTDDPEKPNRVLLLSGLAGLAMGWVFVTRQMDGFILGTATGLWLSWRWWRGETLLRVVAYALGAIASGSAFQFHNLAFTGNILITPLTRYLDGIWGPGANSYGFGPEVGPPGGWGALDSHLGHGPLEGALNTAHNLSGLQLDLFGWGTGSLVLVFALFIWGRPAGRDYAMLSIIILIATAMFFYWFSGGYYLGPRYWFGMLFPVLFLSASGFVQIAEKFTAFGGNSNTPGLVIVVFSMFSLLIFTPWRAVEKFYGFSHSYSEVAQQFDRGQFGNALVFFDTADNQGSSIFLNDPFLAEDRPIFLIDLGPEINARARARFADRDAIYVRH